MPKSKPFTIRLSEEVGGWLERENRRTRLPKSALLEVLAEESIRTRLFPGIGFRGAEHSRRAWVIGTGLDVWELAFRDTVSARARIGCNSQSLSEAHEDSARCPHLRPYRGQGPH